MTDPVTDAANPCIAVSTWQTSRRHTRVSQRLAGQMVADIVERDLSVGAPLGAEAQLAVQYGVGRATIREAVQLLELQGALTTKRGPAGGTFVGEAASHDFARLARLHFQARRTTYGEVSIARRAIEPLMARIAAESATAERLAELDDVLAESDELSTVSDAAFVRSMSNFHIVVARMTDNTVLDTIASIVQEMHDARWGVTIPPERKQSARDVHRAIAAAIRAGDGPTAEHLMREHIQESESAYPRGSDDESVHWSQADEMD